MRRLTLCLLVLACVRLAGATDGTLADLDLTVPAAATSSGLTCTGVTWTPEGLFLPAAAIWRIPRAYPVHGDAFPPPQAPYRADLMLSGLGGRSLTITMLVCLAATTGDQDNLFSLGRRSRWFSAQVGTDGRVVVGLDNRWHLLSATGAKAPPSLADRRWHVISVGLGDDRLVRLAVDGVVAELRPPRDPARFPPRTLAEDQPVLSFADPGSARHLHGLVRRLLVQRGLLDREALIALHRQLAPAGLPPPQTALFNQVELPPPQPAAQGGGDTPLPAGANDF